MVHEVFNGLATHKDPLKALDIPIVPMPAGSGNGTSINLLGIEVYLFEFFEIFYLELVEL